MQDVRHLTIFHSFPQLFYTIFFIFLFIYLFFHLFIHLFIHSFINSFIHSFIHLFIYLFVYLFIYLLFGWMSHILHTSTVYKSAIVCFLFLYSNDWNFSYSRSGQVK